MGDSPHRVVRGGEMRKVLRVTDRMSPAIWVRQASM
jgi:hypothetical protein